jgi:FAD/FMN-containing dehydrogenase
MSGTTLAVPVLRREEPGYDEARRAWNGKFDRRPALIAQPRDAVEVADAVDLARREGLELAVRGGGHSVGGHSSVEDGLLLDLSRLRAVSVDPGTRRARVGGGALLADLDRAAQAHGLVVPAGHVSHTGVAGLTLGGGFGWLSRKLGLTIDSLRSVEVVTADGRIVRASEDAEPELFWAVRGGGGNFGVVTEFEFEAHPLGPMLVAGPVLYPLEQAVDALVGAREAMDGAPDEVTLFATFMTVPAAPDFPPELHGTKQLAVVAVYAGPVDEAEPHVAPFRRLARPSLDMLGPMPYLVLQTMIDATAPHGLDYYARSNFVTEIDPLASQLAEAFANVTSPLTVLLVGWLGGAVSRVPSDATAFPHRDAPYLVWSVSAWPGGEAAPHVRWTRSVIESSEPYAHGVYMNAVADEGEARVRAAYGANWERLRAVKRRYDPDNVFHLNQNVTP